MCAISGLACELWYYIFMLNHILSRDVRAVLSAIGAENLSEKEKTEIMDQISEHFNKIIIDTAVAELNDEQIKEFHLALDAVDAEERITEIAARVPGLLAKIEEAVEQEFEALRFAKDKLSQ